MNTNEIQTEKGETQKEGGSAWIWLVAGAHMLCCGLPLLILSGLSIFAFFKNNPAISIGLAVMGVIGFIWYLKRGCATCPRNEGRCIGGTCKTKRNISKTMDVD